VTNRMFEGRKDFSSLRILDEKITMSDGVTLAARIYLPPEPADAAFPVLFAPSAYQIATDTCPASSLFLTYEIGPMEWYVKEHGYAFVRLDVRGSGTSEGEYGHFDAREQLDYYEVIEWIAEQPWSTGKIGGYGQSYYAVAQWLVAPLRPPHLTCIAPYDGYTEPYTDLFTHGGIPSGFGSEWYNRYVRMPNLLRDPGDDSGRFMSWDAVGAWMQHSTNDEFWKERSSTERLAEIDIPTYSIGIWGKREVHLRGNIRGYQGISSASKWLLIEEPTNAWDAHHLFALEEWHERTLLPFYDRFLKGIENDFETKTPAVSTWYYGPDEYRAWPSWPPASDDREFYLTSTNSGSLTSLNDGGLAGEPPAGGSSTSYAYPDVEWRLGNAKVGPMGPDLIARNVTFTSDPMSEDLEIVGHPRLTLFVSSDQVDTDFIVALTAQAPDAERRGGSQPLGELIARGWLRASHRELDEERSTPQVPVHTHVNPQRLEPGEVYEFLIELSPIAYVLKKGHRLRVMISPTDSPADVGPLAHYYSWQRVGEDTIYHDADRPSRLTVPVLASS
jgi:uncharacterized protein